MKDIIGIICFEAEWEIAKRGNKLPTNSEHLMRFLSEEFGISYIYRRIATFSELEYYIDEFSKPKREYEKYKIIYFSFHGETHKIYFEGSGNITLDELAEKGQDFFRNRYVHFSSCRTMLGSEEVMANFVAKTGAKIITGYTKQVDSSLAAIHDTALIREYVSSKQLPPIFRRMHALFSGLEKQLGFTIYPNFL